MESYMPLDSDEELDGYDEAGSSNRKNWDVPARKSKKTTKDIRRVVREGRVTKRSYEFRNRRRVRRILKFIQRNIFEYWDTFNLIMTPTSTIPGNEIGGFSHPLKHGMKRGVPGIHWSELAVIYDDDEISDAPQSPERTIHNVEFLESSVSFQKRKQLTIVTTADQASEIITQYLVPLDEHNEKKFATMCTKLSSQYPFYYQGLMERFKFFQTQQWRDEECDSKLAIINACKSLIPKNPDGSFGLSYVSGMELRFDYDTVRTTAALNEDFRMSCMFLNTFHGSFFVELINKHKFPKYLADRELLEQNKSHIISLHQKNTKYLEKMNRLFKIGIKRRRTRL